MGDVSSFLSNITGGIVGGKNEKVVSNEAKEVVEDEVKKNKKSRQALFATSGGAQGAELQSGQVQRRATLLGN